MKELRNRRKRIVIEKPVQIKDGTVTFIQPFKELPAVNKTNHENSERINAHELFSLYTADIIKEDSIFIR